MKLAGIAIVVLALARANAEDVKLTKISVTNGGPWGDWRFLDSCPEDSQAVGYELKVERAVADDTALNGVRLLCVYLNRDPAEIAGEVTSMEQIWGSWGTRASCLGGGYLTAFQLKVEPPQDGDDTAANDVRFLCNTGEELSVRNGGDNGDWGEWSDVCPTGICGIETKVESDQGAFVDDTAVNDVRFSCC